MKLRNKKTGEICEFMIHKRIKDSKDGNPMYAPFNDSVEDWQDYEEPKKFWYICDFRVIRGIEGKFSFTREEIAKMKAIGNYFETEEEGEKAVERLKAWKRLFENKYLFNRFVDSVYSLNADSIEFDEYLKDIEPCFLGVKNNVDN